MHVIVAASDAGTRQRLRAQVLGAGLPCDEEVASPALLHASLALREPGEAALVVVARGDDSTVRLALGSDVPVLIWPRVEADAGRFTQRGQRRLTSREREILALVATGTSNKGIARSLRISPNTVKFHLTRLFGKLGVATRAEAIAAAARSGELSL